MHAHRSDILAKVLTARQQQQFWDEGIVFPICVFAAEEADTYRRECDLLETQLGGRPRTVEVRQMHLHFPWAYRLATQARLLDAVEDLLGPDLLIWATELFAKHPEDRVVSIGWHRDGAYMGLDPNQTLTAWVALSPSNASNGCMRVVYEADRRGDARGVRRIPTPDEDQVTNVILEAGEMSLHDVHVLHGSGQNRGEEKRVGFAIRFTTPQARPAAEKPAAVLVRGEDRYGYFDLQPAPDDMDPANATTAMQKSARRHLDATLRNLKQATR